MDYEELRWISGAFWICSKRLPIRRATEDEVAAAHADGR